jgi:hypothetical protein
MLLGDLLQSPPMDDWSKAGRVARVDCGHTQVLRPSDVLGLDEIRRSTAALFSSMPNV